MQYTQLSQYVLQVCYTRDFYVVYAFTPQLLNRKLKPFMISTKRKNKLLFNITKWEKWHNNRFFSLYNVQTTTSLINMTFDNLGYISPIIHKAKLDYPARPNIQLRGKKSTKIIYLGYEFSPSFLERYIMPDKSSHCERISGWGKRPEYFCRCIFHRSEWSLW